MNLCHDLLVFSHLRWDFVYQRPQHLLSHMAQHRRVILIEEPVYDPHHAPHWEHANPEANIFIYRPHTPVESHGFSDDQLEILKTMLPKVLGREGLSRYCAWFYTPMALPLLDVCKPEPDYVIYDCMDELSAFRGAPAAMLERERELLKAADAVFTGGPSLYSAKKNRHPNVYCFPSSVDAKHFGQGRDSSLDHREQAHLARPRLGFYGVIDERFDTELVRRMAESHPEWQISLVGPVVKIDDAHLPKASNIHYFGQRKYEELPNFLAGWDLCLLPFALNESTQFISPTKTLEYMAADKLIVSTPIRDVVEPYGEFVYISATPEDFVRQCERALAAGRVERSERIRQMRDVLRQTSWSRTVEQMEALIGTRRGDVAERAAARPRLTLLPEILPSRA